MDDLYFGHLGNCRIFLASFLALTGVLLYYIPASRSYFCKGCHLLIDAMAYSLKSAVNTLDSSNMRKKANNAVPTYPKSPKNVRYLIDEQYNNHDDFTKNGKIYKKAKKRDEDWPESATYSNRKSEPQRESFRDFKWRKEMSNRQDDGVLYLDNDTVNEGYYDYDRASKMDETKNTSNVIEMNESARSKKRDKKSRQTKIISYPDDLGDHEIDHYKDQLRLLHEKIRSSLLIPDKNLKRQKDLETLNVIEDLLKHVGLKSTKNDIERPRTFIHKKNTNRLSPAVDSTDAKEGDKEAKAKLHKVGNVDNIRTGRKSTTSSRKESRAKSRQKRKNLSNTGNEDFSEDSGEFYTPPIIYDRVTPILKNVYAWIFGGCPSTK